MKICHDMTSFVREILHFKLLPTLILIGNSTVSLLCLISLYKYSVPDETINN